MPFVVPGDVDVSGVVRPKTKVTIAVFLPILNFDLYCFDPYRVVGVSEWCVLEKNTLMFCDYIHWWYFGDAVGATNCIDLASSNCLSSTLHIWVVSLWISIKFSVWPCDTHHHRLPMINLKKRDFKNGVKCLHLCWPFNFNVPLYNMTQL